MNTIHSKHGVFRVITAPEPLDGNADFQLDFIDNVVWLGSHLGPHRRQIAIEAASRRLSEVVIVPREPGADDEGEQWKRGAA